MVLVTSVLAPRLNDSLVGVTLVKYRWIRNLGNQKRQNSENEYSKSSNLVEIVFCIVPTNPDFVTHTTPHPPLHRNFISVAHPSPFNPPALPHEACQQPSR